MKENKNIELISKNNLRVLNDKNFGLNGKYSWLYSYEDACLFYNYGSCFFSLEQFLNYIHLYVGGLDFDPENSGDFESETKLFKEIFLNKKLEIEDWSYSTIICSACSFVLLNDISSRNEINPASAVSLVGLLFESHLSADINKMLVDWDLFSDHVFFQKSLVFLIGFFEGYPVWGELETLNLKEDNKLKLTFEKLFDLLKIDKNTQKVLLNEVLKSQDCEIVIHFLKNYEIPEKSSLDNFNELIIVLDSFEIQNISTHELLTDALTDLESVSVFDLCQS